MTFQEKYFELYDNYEKARKNLHQSTQKISELNGFGDSTELSDYFESHRNYTYHEKEFHKILNFLNNGNIDPSTDFVDKKYMYEFIKQDQIAKKNWQDGEENQFFTCNVGLTNDSEVPVDYQQSHYRFPVLNIEHGKECFQYLTDRLGMNVEKSDKKISELDFTGILDFHKPIFIKVSMRSK